MLPLLYVVTDNPNIASEPDKPVIETPLMKIQDYGVTLSRVVGAGAGTSESGRSIVDVRREKKAVISANFAYLSYSEFVAITSLLVGETVKIKYFFGAYTTTEFQITNREAQLIKAKNEQHNYWNLTVELEEV